MTDSGEPRRPEPEALLEAAAREGRGRLKVYLGMAPGVGKTYAMLEGARRAKSQGVDVVVGVVETHGRKETEELLKDFEILPRKPIIYHGHTLTEFDIDAALAVLGDAGLEPGARQQHADFETGALRAHDVEGRGAGDKSCGTKTCCAKSCGESAAADLSRL